MIGPTAGQVEACRWAFLARVGSATTRRVYAAALAQFDAWLRQQSKGWLEATPEDVGAFCRFLLTRVARPTVGVRLVALRKFYAELVAQQLAPSNPAQIAGPSTRGRPQTAIPDAHLVAALLALPSTRTLGGLRDRCVLRLLGEMGLRVSEICLLRQQDVVRAPGAATGTGLYVGRGTRWARVVGLSPTVKAALDDYLRRDLPLRQLAQSYRPEAALIQGAAPNRSVGGRPLTPRCIFKLVRRYGELLDYPTLNPQMLRRAAQHRQQTLKEQHGRPDS
ncbi:MAG: tyrosine-type recombinase/integrase [Acidobacteriota bacterium]